MKSAAFVALTLLTFIPALAAENFPFWVKTIQAFKYADSPWEATVDNAEQVIGEEGINWIVMAPDGKQLRLPKAYATKITGDEAAVLLLGERMNALENNAAFLRQYNQMVDEANKRIAEYDTALKASQAKVTEYEQEQQAGQQLSASEMQQQIQLLQQLRGLSGKGGSGSMSRSDRSRMENDVWAAGLTRSLYVARQMSDAELQSLWVQARQILETRAAGNRR